MLRVALALLLALAPFASAQPSAVEMAVEAAPFSARLAPLQGVQTTNVEAHVPCALLRAETSTLRFWAEEAPGWTDGLVFAPAEVALALSECPIGGFDVASVLAARATAEAPAFSPAPIAVRASLEGGGFNTTGGTETSVEADYFAILEAHLAEAIKVAPPATDVRYPLEVRNLGNGPSRVTVRLLDASEGWSVVVPPAVELAPKASTTLDLVLRTPEGSGFMNEVGVANFLVRLDDVAGNATAADETTISVLATAKGAAVPGPAPALVLLVLAVFALSRR